MKYHFISTYLWLFVYVKSELVADSPDLWAIESVASEIRTINVGLKFVGSFQFQMSALKGLRIVVIYCYMLRKS